MTSEETSSHHSPRAIIIALISNLIICVMKFAVFALTGSSSMLSEAIHTTADSGNEVLLLLGHKSSKKGATRHHQFGYGRERYINSFLVALLLFVSGGLMSLYEGYSKITSTATHVSHFGIYVSLGVIVFSFFFEGYSLYVAAEASEMQKGKYSWFRFIKAAKNPELPVILLENFAAVWGLLFAAVALMLELATGDPIFDGIGSLMIGLLLVGVATLLFREMRSLLVGESVSQLEDYKIRKALLGTEGVDQVMYVKTQHLGPDEILVVAKIGINPEDSGEEITHIIDAAEERIRGAVPACSQIFIEPDVWTAEEANEDDKPVVEPQ